MRRVKGCTNKACITNKKRKLYKEEDKYCSKCGKELNYVCKKCYTQLPNDSGKYCVRCIAEIDDRRDKQKKWAGVVVLGATGLAVTVMKKGKNLLGFLNKLK